jgi:HK97 family phage major capsid protein
MKRSLKIMMFFGALLTIALVFAGLQFGAFEGLLGLSIATIPILAGIENSDDAKVKRSELLGKMTEMVNTRKKERRQFTDEETLNWEQLKQDVDTINQEIQKLEARELKSFIKTKDRGRRFLENMPGDTPEWVNLDTGRGVKVYDRERRIADDFRQDTGYNLSLGRAIRALVSGDWRGAEAEQRAFSTASGSGLLIPIGVFSSVLDFARAKSIVFAGGARTVLMDEGSMRLARVITDATMETKAENDPFGANSMNFDGISLKAFTIGGIVRLSRELAADAPNTAQAVENALAGALASYIDHLALFGAGTTEPTGIANTSGIQTLDPAGALAYSHLLTAWQEVADANGEPRTIALAPRERAALAGTLTALGYVEPPQLLKELQWLHSSVIPTNFNNNNESAAFVGDFSKLFIGIRQNAMIEISTQEGDAFGKHQAAIKLTFRGDIAVEYPSHFCAITGIEAPAGFVATTTAAATTTA